MNDYEKLLAIIKQSLSGVLPCYLVGRIAERVADALVVEGVCVREDEGNGYK